MEDSKGFFTLRSPLARDRSEMSNATYNCYDMGVDLIGWYVAVCLEQLPCLGKVGPINWKVFLVAPILSFFFFCHLSVY
jgi:hypothetical protein